ncbi:HAD family hydrolase, partial [Streptomyces sp. Act-28]
RPPRPTHIILRRQRQRCLRDRAPDPVRRALELAGASADRSVFVGDTVWDMRAGTRAGVTCVGLLCGGIPRADLVAAGASALYADPADLLAHLDESPLGGDAA